MLKTRDGRIAAPRWGRVLIAALLAAAVVGASALRCPAQKSAGPALYAVSFTDGGTVEAKGAAAPEPFEVPYLPPDAMGVVCFRPSAVLSRPGLKKYAEGADKGIAEYGKGIGLPRAFGLSVAEIAQVSATFRIKTDKSAGGPQTALLCGTPFTIRATRDFDWAKELKELIPGVKESRHGDRVIYHLPTDGPLAPLFGGAKPCYYAPDGRTVVFDTEEGLAARIDRKTADAPAWAADFRRVDRGIAAVVFDNHSGAWARELAARKEAPTELTPFLDHTSWVVFGVAVDDGPVCDAAARFDGEDTAAKATKAIDGWLSGARRALVKFPDDRAGFFLKGLVQEPELKRDGTSVRLRCRAKGDVDQFLDAVLAGEIGL